MKTGADAQALIAEVAPRARAVVFDVDGTLTGADNAVTPGNITALRRLNEAGLVVLVVTGRMLHAAARTLQEAGVEGYLAACNGAIVVDLSTGDLVRREALPDADTIALIEFAEANDVPCVLFTEDAMYMDRVGEGDPTPWEFMRETNDIAPQVVDLEFVERGDVLKGMITAPRARLDELMPGLLARVPQAERTLDDWTEACSPEADKWDALQLILGRLGIDPADVAGAGDGGNDASWLGRIGLGAAMANGRPEAKAVAAIEIGHHLDDGAARFADALLAGRGDLPAGDLPTGDGPDASSVRRASERES